MVQPGATANHDPIGWLDVKKFEATHDAAASQGWAPFVIDVNGNGKCDAGWLEPEAKTDPAKDKRILAGFYGASPSPSDGTVWGSVMGYPGGVARFDPKTKLTEYYEVPLHRIRSRNMAGFFPRGMDVSSTGVVWTVLG